MPDDPILPDCCVRCGATMRYGPRDYLTKGWGGKRPMFLRNVPMDYCSSCGEELIDASVCRRMDRIVQQGLFTEKAELLVYDMACLADLTVAMSTTGGIG